ncbi:18656_t:CDS:2, partial [Acaulospora morrowiae]
MSVISRQLMRSATSLVGSSKFPEVTFSGIQPTGIPHIGNFFGALEKWVSLQQSDFGTNTVLYTIVDLHALTVPQDPKQLRKNKIDMTISLLACGLDPTRSIIFEQSKIPAHSECAWILNCITPVGWLSRMTQWKTKSQQKKNIQSIEEVDTSSGLCLGLFAYPVLQAADILLYKSTHVPIGEDNVQHLELARDIAQRVNKLCSQEIFPLPQPIL